MWIYSLNEEELSLLISKAVGKAQNWLFGKVNNVYVLADGTLVLDYKKIVENEIFDTAGIAVASTAENLIATIRTITKQKNLSLEIDNVDKISALRELNNKKESEK